MPPRLNRSLQITAAVPMNLSSTPAMNSFARPLLSMAAVSALALLAAAWSPAFL